MGSLDGLLLSLIGGAALLCDCDSAAPGSPVTVASLGTPYNLVVDQANVYWVSFNDPLKTPGSIMQVPSTGGKPIVLASDQTYPWGIAIDQSNVYWTTLGAPSGGSNGTIMRVPIGGGPVTTMASGQYDPVAITLAANHIIWSAGDAIMWMAVDGGAPELFAHADSPGNLAADATYLYWVDVNAIMKAPLAGGGSTTVEEGLLPTEVAADGTQVYFGGSDELASTLVDGGDWVDLASGLNNGALALVELVGLAVAGPNLVYLTGDTVIQLPAGGGTQRGPRDGPPRSS